jgi:hypothetical protein
MVSLSLDEALAQRLLTAKSSGAVLCIDTDDEGDDSAPAPPLPKPLVMEKIKPLPPAAKVVALPEKSRRGKNNRHFESDDDDEDDDDESDEAVEAATKPNRMPCEGDMVLIRWDGDPREFLCLVKAGAESGVFVVTSVDVSFKGELDFVPSEDEWRFAEGTTIAKPKAKKVNLAPSKEDVASAVAKEIDAAKGESKPLEGLRFAITGERNERHCLCTLRHDGTRARRAMRRQGDERSLRCH